MPRPHHWNIYNRIVQPGLQIHRFRIRNCTQPMDKWRVSWMVPHQNQMRRYKVTRAPDQGWTEGGQEGQVPPAQCFLCGKGIPYIITLPLRHAPPPSSRHPHPRSHYGVYVRCPKHSYRRHKWLPCCLQYNDLQWASAPSSGYDAVFSWNTLNREDNTIWPLWIIGSKFIAQITVIYSWHLCQSLRHLQIMFYE